MNQLGLIPQIQKGNPLFPDKFLKKQSTIVPSITIN